MSIATVPKPSTTQTAPQAPPQSATLGELTDPRSIGIATIAIRNGSDPKDAFLSLTDEALSELARMHPELHVMINGKEGQKILPIKDALSLATHSTFEIEIGLPCSESTTKGLQTMQRALFPGGIERGIEEATLGNHSFGRALTSEARRAEANFYETLKTCELSRAQYTEWIHRYKADFGFNQNGLHEGAWLQISYRHLKHLAKTNSSLAVMCRNEELPIEPSKRWKATTVKTALHIEKEARKKDPERSKLPGSKLSQFYVYCADPEAALAISLQKPRISHSAMAVYDRLQTFKTFQGAAVAFSLLATAVSSLFQEAVTENVRKVLPSKEPLPVVKPIEEDQTLPPVRLSLKPKSEPQAHQTLTTPTPPSNLSNGSFPSVPNPLRNPLRD